MDPDEPTCTEAVATLLLPACRLLGLHLSESQLSCFAAFCALLRQASQRMNLTTVTNPQHIVLRHYTDSLSLVLCLPLNLRGEKVDILDVGAGAGMPGIPLAIGLPHWRVTLLEASRKKSHFIESTIKELRLTNARVLCERAETLARGHARESFDITTARAVGDVSVLVELCAPLTRIGGEIILFKTGAAERELLKAEKAIAELGCEVAGLTRVPPELGSGDDHFLYQLRKLSGTPDKYPRRPGMAHKRPLM